MLHPQQDSILVETSPLTPLVIEEIPDNKALSEPILTTNPHLKIPKRDIRKSLKALTTEGAFATVFYSIIGGALLS
ncbi:MAG TPA: MFS transporter, partial [Phormidium sp.]